MRLRDVHQVAYGYTVILTQISLVIEPGLVLQPHAFLGATLTVTPVVALLISFAQSLWIPKPPWPSVWIWMLVEVLNLTARIKNGEDRGLSLRVCWGAVSQHGTSLL